jgi:diguanylate cyclase (GGDEF)-like protein/putative nucleotidyltransferase with HDIG domain
MAGKNFTSLPVWPRTYVAAVTLAGATTVALSLNDFLSGAIPKEWLILALLTAVSASAPIRLHSIPVALSVSETFVFTSALLFGPAAGTLTVALDAAVISFWSFRRGQSAYKVIFNICALPLTIWLAAHLFFAIAGYAPLFRNQNTIDLQRLIWPLLVCTVAYFLLSSWIITIAIALERKLVAFSVWRDNFAWISLNYFGGASVSALIVSYTNDLNYTFLSIIVPLLPLLAILYATYSRRVGRVTDANRHLIELNSLYVSTIETLAMAIDAKDQVTHGHIRRVQLYAVGLAKHLGVSDASLIQAIEAAALLHDMGKLAVPEYILNKPGPLTPAEFERMKLHASIGADILSSINFPYPVVPIVRHHHENWNGTGYPDGLKGTRIPLGARILSVVDCYDALTSDRPYRPRLSDEAATKILLERRGSMYDPLIVDTFLKVNEQLAVEASTTRTTTDLELIALAGRPVPRLPLNAPPSALNDIAASTEEMLVLYDLAQGLVGRVDLPDAADIIARHLRRIVPATTCVLFLYEAERDELVATYASGEGASQFADLRIPRGQRMTGWVAANKQSILNSDPVLDLGEAASRHSKPRLRSCLSTPLISDNHLLGVLAVYAVNTEAFTEDHLRLLEVIARQVSDIIRHAGNQKHLLAAERVDRLKLPRRDRVERFVEAEISRPSSQNLVSVVQIHFSGLSRENVGRESYLMLERMAEEVSKILRGADVLCRYAEDDFVVVLTQTDALAGATVAARIGEVVNDVCRVHPSVERPSIGISSAPEDGVTLAALVASADQKRRDQVVRRPGRSPAIH